MNRPTPSESASLPLAATPRSQVMTITPAVAGKWLLSNHNNRPLNRVHVNELVTALRAGHWALNGETIKFSADGRLLDGQHRLHACVLANLPFPSYVTFGLEERSFATIDTGKPRGAKDVLAIQGERETSRLASGARIAFLIDRRRIHIGRISVTNTDVIDYLEANPGLRNFIDSSKGLRQFFGAAVYCGIRYLTYRSHPELCDSFWEAVGSGTGLAERSPARLLRERMIANMGSTSKLRPLDTYALVIKAWNAHVAGRELGALRWTKNEDFPTIL